MLTFLQDLRFGLRLVHRQWGFAAIAVVVLGLGIGANTTIFSLVNALVLTPRPGAGDALVQVFSRHRTEPDNYREFSYPNFTALRDRTDIFASVTAHTPTMVGITEGDVTRRAFIDITTADVLKTFDLAPALGRTFTPEEERPGADIPVTLISYPAWQRMGAPADVVGRTVRLNQREFRIVGVTPEGFSGSTVMFTPELWVPTGVYESVINDFASNQRGRSLDNRDRHALIVYARLRDGLTPEAAAPGLEGLGRALEAAYPDENRDQTIVVGPLSRLGISSDPEDDSVVAVLGTTLLGMSGIVLLVASFNLANMQLARATTRRKELAIRLSMGGSPSRLVRQLLTETLVLSAAGGLLAILLSSFAMHALVSGMSGMLPIQLSFNPTPDLRVFAATLVFAATATLVSSLGPALAASRRDLLPDLKEQAGEVPARRRRLATRHLLVMGQVTLSLALLAAAGAFIRGAVLAAEVDPGFSLDRGIHVNIDAGLAGYTPERTRLLYGEVIDRLRQVPGVTHVAIGSLMPFGEITESQRAQRPGPAIRSSDPGADVQTVSAVALGVSNGYFPSLGLALLRGRDFTDAEWRHGGGTPVAIVDQRLATHLFGAEDPIGRMLQLARGDELSPEVVEIVGIAPAILHSMTTEAPEAHVYRPYAQRHRSGVLVHLRTDAADEAGLLGTIRQELRRLDSQLPVLTLETSPMFRERNPVLWIIRTAARLFTAFGVVALLMAALGIYGVKAYLVARRTREIGIRMALGATARDVVGLVLRDGLTYAVVGLMLGFGLSLVVVRSLGHLFFGGGGLDAPIVLSALVALAGAALLANWIPARRAARIPPAIAFKA